MEAAVGAASWLIGKVLTQLSNDLVAAYVSSTELGPNMEEIKRDLKYTQGLLHMAQGRRDISDNAGLQGLLEDLSNKADEAEDALDEIHYFIIQDQIDGTHEAIPEVDGGLHAHVIHGRHALRHTVGNWFPCFFCSSAQDDIDGSGSHDTPNFHSDIADHVGKLRFNRVDVCNKIKLVIKDMQLLCNHVSDLLKTNHTTVGWAASLKRPPTSSTSTQDKLYGRENIFKQTLDDMTNCSHTRKLSVLPIVGPGGIGKTTFVQHLYNDKRTEAHFSIKIWVCASTNFDVLRLTQEILNCIPHTENEGSSAVHESSNLDQLQKTIEKRLKSDRFLLVLDDMWRCSSEAEWKNLVTPFKKGEADGNIILVTTRFPSIAQMLKTTEPIELQGLEDSEFFTFFEACIFGQDKPEYYENDLIDMARNISKKLRGSPLAAKTFGRLLKNNLSQESWKEVLENNEWRNMQSDDDIMPALKISYDYLPFYLKKCFSYCALYPEDHRFNNLEITCFWEAIGIIDSGDQNNKVEAIGLKYLDELIGNGFLMKVDDDECQYYVMHDLLHELAQNVSSQECINIRPQSFRSDNIPQSIRHVSITLEYECSESFGEEMENLKRKIDIKNLRSLMFFGRYNEDMAIFLKNIFKEIECLRVLFMFANSVESFPYNFSKLIHLRYLKLEVPYNLELSLPGTICRLYHLKVLDLGHSNYILPKDISRLANLHHFFAKKELCSSIPGIGKMKYLQRLEEFHVKKEGTGFEMRELGELKELGGSLEIFNLENVATKEEANDAKLMFKRNMKTLKLVWGAEQRTDGSDVIDGLQPHPYLRALGIRNHGGSTGPSWLCDHIYVKNLKSLRLEGISWNTLPPFGQFVYLEKLTLINIGGIRQFGPDFGGVTQKSFLHLKKIKFVAMPELAEWVGGAHCHLFSKLASIKCIDCPNLSVLLLPSSECSTSCPQDINTIWFPSLSSLKIRDCPKLSLPPMPHTTILRHVTVERGHEEKLHFDVETLSVDGYGGALATHNLVKVEDMKIKDTLHISWTDLQKQNSLTSLTITGCKSLLSNEVDDGVIFRSVEQLKLYNCHLAGKSLTKLLNCFPALTMFELSRSPKVEKEEETVLTVPSAGLLRYVKISGYENLVLPMEAGGGSQDFSSLQEIEFWRCGKIFALCSMVEAGAQTSNPFLASLRALTVCRDLSMQSMVILSNLTSLTRLRLVDCGNLTLDGFDPIITCNLMELMVYNIPEINDNNNRCSIAADLFSEVAMTNVIPVGSFQQLNRLEVDSISGVFVSPICSLLAATLFHLIFRYDLRMESFSGKQEQALQLLTSLQCIEFCECHRLQSLPQGLHRLSSVYTLGIVGCPKIRSLPKDGIPASLKELRAMRCSVDLKDQLKKLEESNPDVQVFYI